MALVVINDDVFSLQTEAMVDNFDRIVGQIFRLLPMREEGVDYIKPLDTLIVELSGYFWIIPNSEKLIALLGKLRGLKSEECSDDFMLFRRMVFEACNIASALRDELKASDA